MHRGIATLLLLTIAQSGSLGNDPKAAAQGGVQLITVDPGHFHAALIQRDMLPGVRPTVHVYAPLGSDLVNHLGRIAAFNHRGENPTRWESEIYAGPGFLARVAKERPGGLAVLSGRNREKIKYMEACVNAGLHVLADKPWIIEAADLPRLERVYGAARRKGVVIYDAMTLRFATMQLLQRALVNDPEVFGSRITGSKDAPAVSLESVHSLLKKVDGLPNLRPAWFFDVSQAGEGLTDVGTHLVDLVQWNLFPDQAIDYRKEVRVVDGARWALPLTLPQFREVTGERGFPGYLKPVTRGDSIDYYCNNSVDYTLRGIHARVQVSWLYSNPVGSGDTNRSVFRGSRAAVELRQGREEGFVTELYVEPAHPADKPAVIGGLNRRLQALAGTYPGLRLEDQGGRIRVVVPQALRVGNEAFLTLTGQFLEFIAGTRKVGAWEQPNTLAKYYVTTEGVAAARRKPVIPAKDRTE